MTEKGNIVDIEGAAWASEQDRAAWVHQIICYGSAYSQLDSDGLRRFIDINDFRAKPPEPGPHEIRNPWLP